MQLRVANASTVSYHTIQQLIDGLIHEFKVLRVFRDVQIALSRIVVIECQLWKLHRVPPTLKTTVTQTPLLPRFIPVHSSTTRSPVLLKVLPRLANCIFMPMQSFAVLPRASSHFITSVVLWGTTIGNQRLLYLHLTLHDQKQNKHASSAPDTHAADMMR